MSPLPGDPAGLDDRPDQDGWDDAVLVWNAMVARVRRAAGTARPGGTEAEAAPLDGAGVRRLEESSAVG
jgi:hypothetical protein